MKPYPKLLLFQVILLSHEGFYPKGSSIVKGLIFRRRILLFQGPKPAIFPFTDLTTTGSSYKVVSLEVFQDWHLKYVVSASFLSKRMMCN